MEFLIIISIIILVITLLISKDKLCNPIVLFNGMWIVSLVLYKINYLGFINVSDKTILILGIMILFFPLGVICGIKNRIKIVYKKQIANNKQYIFNEKLLSILCYITIVFLFYTEIHIIMQLYEGDTFNDIIHSFSGKGTVIIKGPIMNSINIFIVAPVSYIISPIAASLLFNNHKNKWKFFILNIIIVALNVAHHGGRNHIFLMIISYLFTYFMTSKKEKLSIKHKLLIVVICIVVTILILLISKSRGFDDLFSSYYAYLTCSIPLTEIYINELKDYVTTLGGYFSFNGFFYPLMSIIDFFEFGLPNRYILTQSVRFFIEDNYVYIGEYNHLLNAFLPIGTYFYFDGGILFEIIGMFLYGFITGCFYKKVFEEGMRLRKYSIYVFILIGLILSFTRCWFSSYNYALAFLYFYIIFTRRSKKVYE